MSQARSVYQYNRQTSSARAPILTLSPEVAERIAAGEVIERPLSVVKELVENALDAGASEIRVEVRGGGLRLIRVSDDGYGIPENELELACTRHSTSKINSVEDLGRLRTLGFRGEALASIAAVSELTLLSRAIETEALESGQEQAAAWLTIRGGEVGQRGHRARPHGTTVTVRDLFYNVPARLNFMRTASVEARYITQLLQRYVLGYPAVRFTLVIDDHIPLQTSGSGELATVLAELYRLPLAELITPVTLSAEGSSPDQQTYRLHGYIGNRALAQNTRQYITLFVNGRLVQSRSLQAAFEAGYRGLLPKGKHPLLVFHLDVPPTSVDVNVHPAKTEVRLIHEDDIATALTQAVRSVLERSPASPEAIQFPGPTISHQLRLPGPRRRGLHVSESAGEYLAETTSPAAAEILLTLRPLAQLQQAVILAEAPDGSLYLVDQHRAHERVLYEHLLRIHTGGRNSETNLLLEPVIVELKRRDADLLEQRLPILHGLGFECERFGGRSFLIRSVPGGEGQEQLVAHLHELAEIASEDSTDWQDHLLISLACRSSLRRGRELGLDEQRALLTALAGTTAPAVCPHGSPILLHYSRTFLIDKFDW